MTIYDMVMPVLQLMANSETAMMALFTAYIDDYLGFEIFCSNLPHEFFNLLRDDLRKADGLCDALRDSKILEQGVEAYISRSFEDYHMWYHFLDGTAKILTDSELADMLASDDRCVAESLLALWEKGEINEENWNEAFVKLCQ